MLVGMRCVLSLFTILILAVEKSQSTGSFGRDFYIGILKAYSYYGFSILITSNTSGTATINMPDLGVNITRSFNQSLEYGVTRDIVTQTNRTVENKGIHVTTDVDVTLVVINYPSNTWEGFLALPATMLSTTYVISSHGSHYANYKSDFLILSLYDNTDIEVRVNGRIYSVSMNYLDTYLYNSMNDLSGSIVKSNKPVAVFSGHEASRISDTTDDGGEYLVEQLLPKTYFAHEFIVPPTPPKSRFVIRVYSSVQKSTIVYSNVTSTYSITLPKSGDFHQLISNNDPMYLSADKPVQVMLYATSYTYNHDNIGNSFMSIIPSISQFTNSYHFTVVSRHTSFAHYLIIISRNEYISSLRVNGQKMRNLFHTYNVSHSNLTFTVNVYNIKVGVYHLHHVHGKPFGAMQYGFTNSASDGSYGYILGMNSFIGCGPLNAPLNGLVDISGGTLEGNQALYSCVPGYTLHGEHMRTCQSDGFWNDSQPTCGLLDCGITNAPVNGIVSFDNGTTYLSTASYNCNIGFDIHGPRISVCQADGTWSNRSPSCAVRDCGNLNAPVNGHVDISNGTTFGSQAVYSCKSGYTLYGEQTRTCLADGYWNGSQPNCQSLDCGNLNAPVNGHVDISYGTTFGSQAIYSCTSGYTLHGEQTRTCLADGYWNGSQPNCQPLGGELTCLECKDMSHLYLCDTVTTCSDGQVCYVETFKTNGGQVKYNSGCVDSHQCSSWKRQISRRSTECVHCCSSQLCNANGCGGQGLPSADIRGPLCYECSYVSNMEECKTVKLCARNEVCSIEKYDWGGVYDHYTTKCHSKQCLSHKRSFDEYVSSARTSRTTPVFQNCCSSDLCNTNCNMTLQSGTGVAIVG